MKKIFPLVLLLMFTVMQSCEKHDEGPKKVVLNVTLASGEDYRLDLKQYKKEGATASITRQASNFSISEIEANSIYHYQAAAKTGITDKVVIIVSGQKQECGNGQHDDDDDDDDDDDATNIIVNFTIK